MFRHFGWHFWLHIQDPSPFICHLPVAYPCIPLNPPRWQCPGGSTAPGTRTWQRHHWGEWKWLATLVTGRLGDKKSSHRADSVDFFGLNKAYESQNVWTFTPFFCIWWDSMSVSQLKVQMTLDVFGGRKKCYWPRHLSLDSHLSEVVSWN